MLPLRQAEPFLNELVSPPIPGVYLCLLYREDLIYVVRGSHLNIASFLKRGQKHHNTPLFLPAAKPAGHEVMHLLLSRSRKVPNYGP